ncbi:valyl-trna synthetase [Seiridium cupressi]
MPSTQPPERLMSEKQRLKLEKFKQKQENLAKQAQQKLDRKVKSRGVPAVEAKDWVENTPAGQRKILKPLDDDFRKAYLPEVVESAWCSFWKKHALFQPQTEKDGSLKTRGKYVIAMPPPNEKAEQKFPALDSGLSVPLDGQTRQKILRDIFQIFSKYDFGDWLGHYPVLAFPQGIPDIGADALRFSLVNYTQSSGSDINFDIKTMHGYRKLCNKIYQATKYVLGRLGNDFVPRESGALTGNESLSERWILTKMNAGAQQINQALEEREFAKSTQINYRFL